MFCPICGYEYRQGFIKCSDCGVALVHTLPDARPPVEETVFQEYVFMGVTSDPGLVMLIKSLLDAEGIGYYFHGENSLNKTLFPIAARLMVRADQSDRAKALLSEIK